jgi:hypothetical protein
MANNRDYGAMSSDSEISDSEAINPGSRRHRDNAKIRINALLCLQAIAKVESYSRVAYFPKDRILIISIDITKSVLPLLGELYTPQL